LTDCTVHVFACSGGLHRSYVLIVPQSLPKRQKPGLTADNDYINDEKHVPKITVLHTAAAVFEFQLDRSTEVQTHLCRATVTRMRSF